MEFKPLSTEFSQNPYDTYTQLRLLDKPYYASDLDMWMLARYDDVSQVAISPDAVRSLVGYLSDAELAERQRKANWHDMPHHERFVQFSLLDSDGDIHKRLRQQVFTSFASANLAGLEAPIQHFVDRLLCSLGSEIDFVNDFAAHIPGFVIGLVLGAPEEDGAQLRQWSEQIVQFFDIDRSDERKEIAETATREFYEYLVQLKNARIREPQNDLISKMIVDEAAGLYSEDEFISTCMLILMAGHGSTIDVLSSGMHTLLKFPNIIQELKEDISILPLAIQEMFRYESPLPFFHRHMTEEISIRGHQFPKGTTFGLLYGAANRDPEQFDDPDVFKVNRHPNRHLAFGRGIHLCLGNHLARLNMKIIFETLLRELSTFELLDQPVTYKRGLSVRGPESLPMRWS